MRFTLRFLLKATVLIVAFFLFVQFLRFNLVAVEHTGIFSWIGNHQFFILQHSQSDSDKFVHLFASSSHLETYADNGIMRQLRRVLYSTDDFALRRNAVNAINHYQFVRNIESSPLFPARKATHGDLKTFNESISGYMLSVATDWANLTSPTTDPAGADFLNEPELRGSASGQEFVIVVQTHDRVHYLRELLASLGNVVGIERALLIVSHDFYSEEIEDLMNTVRCPLIQLFFPFAFDWFDKQYPADDRRDCGRDAPQETAKKLNCTNAQWADTYGHYREAKFTQTKQHYIWKLSFVFNYLRLLRYYNGPVIFLEDDYVVSDDLLHIAKLAFNFRLLQIKKQHSQSTSIVTLGNYEKLKFSDARVFTHTLFKSTKNNIGMMVDRSFWKSVMACSKLFCEYDDYNWDWTLQYLSFSDCIKGGLKVYSAALARVHHIGYCGIHYKKDSCDPAADAASVRSQLLPHRDTLHAVTSVEQVSELRPYESRGLMKPNGGWGDLRDQELCKANMMGVQAYVTDVKESSMAVGIVKNLLRLTYSMSTAG